MEQLQAVLVLGGSRSGASRSNETPTKIIQIPHLLSVLATGTWSGPVTGLNQLQAQYQAKYGPGQLHAGRVHPILVDAGHGRTSGR